MSAADLSVPVSVEVSVSEIMQGVFEIEGVLHYAAPMLVFTYQTKNARGRKSDDERFELPLEALHEVELKGWMLGAKIVLRPRQLATLAQVPWTCSDQIVFRVKQTYREQAAALVDRLAQELDDRGIDDDERIPFQLPDANLGLTEIKGLLYLEDDYLVFDVGTSLSGASKLKRHTIKIELRALTAIRFEPGTFRDHLYVRPKERDLFRAMPGMYKGKDELPLTIKKRHREDAERLIDEARRRRG